MRSVFYIFLLLLVSVSVQAQEVVEVVQIEKDDGLKDRTVDRVIRDDQGYFILFFLNTIQRYDGREFENIDISAFKNQNLEVRNIERLDKLEDGTIIMYVEGVDMLFYLPPRGESVLIAPLRGIPLVNNKKLFVLKTKQLDDENKPKSELDYNLYDASLGGNITTEKVSNVSLPWDIQSVAMLDNTYYFQYEDGSIYQLENERLSKIEIAGKLIQRANGIYVFGTKAIYKVTGQKVTKVTDLHEESLDCSILKLDGEDNIVAAYQEKARFYNKVYVLDKNDTIHFMEGIVGVSNMFKDFHTDDAFYRWMLGGYNGIHVVNLLRDGSEIIFKRPTTKKGEFGIVISGVATDHQKEVIFSRELIGLFDYDKESGEFSEVLKKHTEVGQYERNAKLYYHEKSKSYYSHGYRYDGKSDVYKSNIKNNTSEKHLIPIKLNDIYVEAEDNLLLGGWISKTDTGIIASYNLKTKKYEIISETTPPIRSIYFDEETQRYWIGTYKGLYIFDKTFKLQKSLHKSSSENNGLENDHVVMCQRYNGKILAGTYGGGVFVIDPINYKVVKQISEENGLTDNAAIGLMNDDLGHCWVTTFNGVNVINSDFDVIRKIYEHDGLPNREFNSKAIAKDGDGVIYAGTLNGVAILDPEKILKWKKSFGIDLIEILGYEGENVERIEMSTEITLLEAYDSIQIKYNLPDYHMYPYVDENLDISAEGLTIRKKEDVISLSKFKNGDYFLSIKPKGEGESMEIAISRKSNYKRYLLFFMSFLLVSLLAYLISKIVIRNTRKREEEKTKLNKRISDLQLSSLQSQMNPHFIFNALGAVQYFIQTHDTERADEYLSNFAMLMRSILESSKSKYIRLNEEIRLLELYVGLEKVRFEELFKYDIKVDVNVDTEVNIPPMIVQPFVENAINHGLYNLKGREGYLLIHFGMPNEDKLIITITDNGVGRERAAELRMKKHKSRGTQIVQERLATLNQGNELSVETETIDIVKNGTAMGTKVIITIDANEK